MKGKEVMMADSKVMSYLRKNTLCLYETEQVDHVLERIKKENISEKITYLYVVDDEKHLKGVVPLRALLESPGETLITHLMHKEVVSLPSHALLSQAEKYFQHYKYLSLPVVGEGNIFLGVIDVTALIGEAFSPDPVGSNDYIFETIGVRSSFARYKTPKRSFRYRFPWLIPTCIGGLFCAFLTSIFETTLAQSIILAFFLTLILGLGESVSIQALSIVIQELRIEKISLQWYLRALRREILTSLLLGAGTGLVLALIVFLWQKEIMAGVILALSLLFVLVSAGFWAVTVPAILHTTRLDPKVAAGPLVLGLTDICTLLLYFSTAKGLL